MAIWGDEAEKKQHNSECAVRLWQDYRESGQNRGEFNEITRIVLKKQEKTTNNIRWKFDKVEVWKPPMIYHRRCKLLNKYNKNKKKSLIFGCFLTLEKLPIFFKNFLQKVIVFIGIIDAFACTLVKCLMGLYGRQSITRLLLFMSVLAYTLIQFALFFDRGSQWGISTWIFCIFWYLTKCIFRGHIAFMIFFLN